MSHNPAEYYPFDPHGATDPSGAGAIQGNAQCLGPSSIMMTLGGGPLQGQPHNSVMHQQHQPQHQQPQQHPTHPSQHPQIALVAPAIHHPQMSHSLGMQPQQPQPQQPQQQQPPPPPPMDDGLSSGLLPTSSLPTSMPPSVTSSVIRALSGSQQQRPRSEKKPIPEELKDDKYCERRRRNNLAAKKSRDARKAREDEIAIRASFLEKENAILRAQVATLREEANSLRQILLAKRTGHT